MSRCSKKQPTVSKSSTESEYRCLFSVTAIVVWLESLLNELRININRKVAIWCDNLSAISVSANPILHTRTKHMKLDLILFEKM